jgi:hypothetical protein
MNYLDRIFSFFRKYQDGAAIIFYCFIIFIFFYKTFIYGLLPVPSDTLVGLYNPYRDTYISQYPRGVPFKNFLITDPIRQQIPWRKLVIDGWKSGKIPTWDASSFSGTTLIGNIQAGVFYPLNIFFFLFPFQIGWTILIISQPLLSGLFLYFFLRNKKLDPIPALIGGLCFAFGGYATAWMTWGTIVSTFLWTPLALLSVDNIHTSSKKNFWRFVLLFALISSFFAGHIQLFVYGFCMVVWYTWWQYRKSGQQRFYAWHMITFTLFLLITSIQWIPLIHFLGQTGRGATGASWMNEGFFIPLRQLIQFIAPDYFGNPATLNYWGIWNYGEMVGYIGLAGLILGLFGIGSATMIWVIPIIVSLVFSVQSPIAQLPYSMHIPILSLFQPTRLMAVIDFSLSILAAYGAAALIEQTKKIKWMLFFLIFAGLLLWVSVFMPKIFLLPVEQVAVIKRNVYLPTVLAVGIGTILLCILFFHKKKNVVTIALLFLLCINVFDLVRFSWKFTPFTNKEYFFPETKTLTFLKNQIKPFRIMALDDRILPPDVFSYYKIESVSGYDPIHNLRYDEYIAAMERNTPNIDPPFGFDRMMSPKNISSPLFNLLGVKYIVSLSSVTDSRFRKVSEEGESKIYQNATVLPRVYLVESVDFKQTKQEVINELYDKSFQPSEIAVVEEKVPVTNIPLNLQEAATIQSYQDDQIIIKTQTSSARFLFINTILLPGWHVFIDHQETKLYRANYLFMGVIVPAGTHTVEVKYSYL